MAEELNNLDADLTADALADAIGEPDLVNDPVETPELTERELELERSKEIASEISVNSDLNASDQFLIGNDIKFSAKQQNVEKYLTYDKDTVYGKLGFNPFLDQVLQEDGKYKSGMDHLYDENTTASDDLWRAYDGMLELATIGFQDTFALGAFHDDDNYIDFENVMSKYSSSKGGSTGFWSNTMLSSGYTAGIITAIAAEELALTLATGGIGAIGGTGTIAGSRAFRFLSKGKKQGKFVDAAEELSDIKKATTWLGRRKQAFGKGAKSFGRAVNPIGETMDFVRNIDRVKDFNGLKATALGAASVVRDMRKIYMAHSESQLEADMAEKDFREKNYDDYYIDYVNLDKNGNPTMKNVGTNRSDEWAANMDREAKRVHDNVYAGNFGLIYLTNAVTFDNMFKHMKGTGKMFGYSASGAYKVVRNVATKKVTVNALKKKAGQYARNKVAGWTYLGTAKSGIKSVATSSMEGVQELGQDILSESFKDYHSRNVQGTQAKGGLMHYLQNDLVHAVKKQNSKEGLETFLSGMFMGVFASPVGFATGQINTFVNGGGFISAKGTYNKIFNKEKYKKEQEAEMAKLEKEAEFLTKFFNENKNFLESWSKPIARQAELQEEMLEAAQNGHKEKFKSAQNESFTNGLKRVIKAGLSGQMIDNLNYMATELNAEELSQLMARTDITEENIGEFRKKLLDNAELLENLDLKFRSIEENFVNPITLSELDPKSDNYINQYIEYVAFESLKDELLFSHSKIVDRAKRLKEIKEIIKNENPLSQEFSVESLVDLNSLNSTIQTFQAEVEANKTMNLTGSELVDAKLTERRLKALEAYKVVLAQTEELLYNANSSESEAEVYEEMLDVYQEVVKAFGKQRLTNEAAQKEIDSKAFDLIFDYIVLEKQEGEYTKYAETLMTDSGASEFVDSQKLMLNRLEKNKKAHIKNALIEFNKKKLSNEMLSALYGAGVFFDLQYLDDLLNNRVSPEEFINLENNEPATAEQTRAALKILDRYIKKLTGKPIIKSGIKKGSQGRKLKQDKRTVKGILRQYNIKLDTNINLSSKAGLKLLNRLMQNENKYLTELDREILMKVIEQEATIRFVDDQSLPIQINEAGVITIDVRFAGEDYVNSPYSIENLITTALTQNKILEDLVENDDLWLQARDAMRQAKQQYARLYPKEDVDNMPVFNSVDVFLSEALNDAGFQYLLSQIEDKVQPTKKSLWSTIKKGSEAIIEEKFENKLVNRVINIAAKAVDDTIVDNISEINRTLRTDEAQEALDKRTEELKVMGARLGLQWNVNVKILKDQQEALEYLDKIKNPFYSKEEGVPAGFYDEKTNTAYIVAENAKANTPYHEIFLHPFLINAEKKNPELYKALIAEAKADQAVVDYVEKNYGKEETIGSRQFEHELVGRVYELAMANEINEKEKPGLFKRIYEFAKLMIKETAKFLKILPKDVSKFKPNKTTIKDLAKYSTKQEGINLGAIIEGTEDVTPKVEKVKVKKTVTKEIQENVGGNTVVMTEARDQPSLMEDFINDDIQLENADSVNAATDEIVALGKELDEIDVLASNTSDLIEVEKGKTKLPLKDNLGTGEQKTLKTEYSFGTNGALGVYVNEQTGSEDVFLVIPDKKSDKNYIGFKRVYKDGKPTNEFSIKADMSTAEKGSARPSFEAINEVLPEGFVLIETTNISSDAMTMWSNQIKNGYKPTGETFTVDVNTDGKKIDLGGTKSNGDFSKANFTEQELAEAEVKINDLIKDLPGAKIESRKITPPMVKDALYSIKVTLPKLEKPKKEDLKTTTKEANWKFGDLRVEIDGRLIIDVIANGKRFLMYKSTGTGTTADTAGEWTPLLYFGTQLKKDGTGRKEWFVKAIFEGQDPKKNKYGSKTFIGLDSLLKAQESELFTGQEKIQTRTETEEIEVEEEVVKEKIVDEDLNTSIGVQNKIDNINAQINTAKENLEKGQGTFIEKRRLSNKIAKLQIQANELYAKKKELLKEEEKKEGPILESDPEYVPVYDTNKNEIITPEMPFARMPKVLQTTLAKLYGKPLTALEQEDIDAIAELRETNPEYIAAVNKYSQERFEREEQKLNEKEVKLNQEKIDKAKAKRRVELAKEKTQRKGKKVRLTLEEKISKLPGANLLTDAEIIDLANQIRNQQGVFPFGFQEIRNIIIEKKRAEELSRPKTAANMTAEELKAVEEQQKRWDEQARESRKKKEQIEQNIKRLGKSGPYNAFLFRKLDKENKKLFKRNEINIPNGMRQFILKYHPEIFSLDEEAFNVRINNIMRNYRDMRSSIIPANFKFKSTDPLEILKEVKTLMNKLDAEKKLYPSVVVQINRALNETEATYTIKRLGSKQLRNSASMYDLKFTPNKKSGKDVIMPERIPGTSSSAILKNADIEDIRFQPETQGAIALADILLRPNVRLSREFFLTLDITGTREGRYDAWISEDVSKQLIGIGMTAIQSTSALGELIEENLSSLLNISTEEVQKALGFGMVPGQSLVEDLMADTFTRDALRQRVADMITDDYQAAKDAELDFLPEELVSLKEYAEWSTTKEGKKIIEEEMASRAEDTPLYEEMFIEEMTAREEEETRDEEEELSLPEIYFGKTAISEELNKTIKVNEQLKIIWGALTNEKQNDLNYVKAVFEYTKVQLEMTPRQKALNDKLINEVFSSGAAQGSVVNIDNQAFIISNYIEKDNQVELTLLNGTETDAAILLTVPELLSKMVEELTPGTVFNGQVIDTVANATEIQYIKEAYSDILTNFINYTKEAELLSDEQLLEDLKTEITKCK